MVLAHFKNDTIKGTQHLPMAIQMFEPFIYLENAHQYLASHCPTLWFNAYGETYQEAYWSTISSQALTLADGRRITAKDFRHLFATAWRDFINIPSTIMADLTTHQLDAAAADLMCSSTHAFTNSYDDTNRVRGNLVVLAKYKAFKAYIESRFKVKQTEE